MLALVRVRARKFALPSHLRRATLCERCASHGVRYVRNGGSFCEKRTRHAEKRSLHYQKELLCLDIKNEKRSDADKFKALH